MNTWLGREPVESQSGYHFQKYALEAFQALKQACMSSPILAFAHYTKDFLLETDTSKEGLGVVLSQKQADGYYHPVTYGSLGPHSPC